jgi:hypothetical protein
MTRSSWLAAALAAAAALAMTSGAEAYSGRVKAACKRDFYTFCPSYKLDSPQLRACMRSAGGNVSSRCVDALADAGEIAAKYHSRNRK